MINEVIDRVVNKYVHSMYPAQYDLSVICREVVLEVFGEIVVAALRNMGPVEVADLVKTAVERKKKGR